MSVLKLSFSIIYDVSFFIIHYSFGVTNPKYCNPMCPFLGKQLSSANAPREASFASTNYLPMPRMKLPSLGSQWGSRHGNSWTRTARAARCMRK